MHSNSVERVLNYLDSWQPDLLLLRHNECNVSMEVIATGLFYLWKMIIYLTFLKFNLEKFLKCCYYIRSILFFYGWINSETCYLVKR